MLKISSDIFLIEKTNLTRAFFYIGILVAYWGTLLPWFFWGLSGVYYILSAIFIFTSFMLSSTLESSIFSRKDFQVPILAYLTLVIAKNIVNGSNINSYIGLCFDACIFLSLFLVNLDELKKLMKFLCITMASLLVVSIFFFILFLIGFPLPNTPLINEELGYSFVNYYFFMVYNDIYSLFMPRFSSVFLEPGHLGTASVLLLSTQIGLWKKWYNIVLIFTTLITFSLAAYVLFLLLSFQQVWIRHKKILSKLLLLLGFFSLVAIGSMIYNDGDNLINTLIIERLEVNDDGKLSGDNRVTDKFEAEFNDYMQSDDILLGRDYDWQDFGWGNAGYRVFIYDNGLIVLFLVIMLYILMTLPSTDKRAVISMLIFGVASFWVRANPITYYYFIPMYAFAYIGNNINEKKD